MNRTSLLAVLAIFFVNTSVFGQPEKEIVAAYSKALGKSVDQTAIKTLKIKGIFTFQKFLLPAEMYYKLPRLGRIEMHFQSLAFIQISNDSLQWEYNPFEQKSKLTTITSGKESNAMQGQSFDFVRQDLIHYKRDKHALKLVGKQKIDSVDVFVLRLTPADNSAATKFYLSTKNNLLVRIEDEEGRRIFKNYKNVDGFVLPTYIFETSPKQDMEVTFKEVEINKELSDTLFVIPKFAFDERDKAQHQAKQSTAYADSLAGAGQYELAIKEYTKLLEHDPQKAQYFNARGLAKLNSDQFYEAIADFSRALEIEPTSTTFQNNIGLAKFYLGDFKGAVKEYTIAIEREPTAIEYKNRGFAYLRQNQYEEAKKDFEKAVQLSPDNSDVHFSYAICLAQMSFYKEAIVSYNKVLALGQKTAEVYNYRGVSYYKLNKYDSASLDFAQAVSLAPGALQYLENHGMSLYYSGEYKAANTQFEKYLVQKKDNPSIHNMIGLCKYQEENFDGAIQNFSTAINLNGTQATYFDNRAAAKENLEDYEGAIKDYSESIRLYPNDGSTFYKRGLIKLKTSKKLEGCSDLGTAHEMKYEPAKEAIMTNCNGVK